MAAAEMHSCAAPFVGIPPSSPVCCKWGGGGGDGLVNPFCGIVILVVLFARLSYVVLNKRRCSNLD